MISILAQERLLGFDLGSACAGIAVFEQRRRVYDSISSHDRHPLSVRPSQGYHIRKTIPVGV